MSRHADNSLVGLRRLAQKEEAPLTWLVRRGPNSDMDRTLLPIQVIIVTEPKRKPALTRVIVATNRSLC